MIRHNDGRRDGRYTVTQEYCGQPKKRHVARFCGDWIGHADNSAGAWRLAERHNVTRQAAL